MGLPLPNSTYFIPYNLVLQIVWFLYTCSHNRLSFEITRLISSISYPLFRGHYDGETPKKSKIYFSDYFDISFCVLAFLTAFLRNEIFSNTDL